MQKTVSSVMAISLFLTLSLCLPLPINAQAIPGDINGNGIVSMEEAVYALQVIAGLRPGSTLNPNIQPEYSAWGTYSYASGILTMNFTFSNFAKHGPPIGTFQVAVLDLSETVMTTSMGGRLEIWSRTTGTAGSVVGLWERSESNNTFRIILDGNGRMLYSAYGDAFTEVVDVPKSTITVDGDFTDWNQSMRLNLFFTEGDCGGYPGREIQEVYVAQDDNYVYLRMKLNGSPDPTFRYKFGEFPHIRVTPPPNPSIHVASSACGCSIPNPLIVFSGDQFEARFDKCFIVDDWDNDELSVWSDQDSVSICRNRSVLPILNFDVSVCND